MNIHFQIHKDHDKDLECNPDPKEPFEEHSKECIQDLDQGLIPDVNSCQDLDCLLNLNIFIFFF